MASLQTAHRRRPSGSRSRLVAVVAWRLLAPLAIAAAGVVTLDASAGIGWALIGFGAWLATAHAAGGLRRP